MHYDLYGNSYKSDREAMNAELAQMSEIDNRIQRIHNIKQQYDNRDIWQYIHMLEERIKSIEDKQSNP